jgi:hypothetical protein
MGWLAISFVMLSGCATSPTPLSEEARAKIGRIAVQAVQSAPKIKLSVPYTRGQGAAAGVFHGMEAVVGGLGDAPPGLAVVALPFGVVAGAVIGVKSGAPREKTAESERTLRQFCAAVDFQEWVRREVAAEIRKSTRHPLAKGGTESTPPANSLLEIEVLEVGLDGSQSKDAKLELFLRVQARLLSWPDGAVLYRTKALWSSRYHGLGADMAGTVFAFNEWAARDALLFQRYLGVACLETADSIVAEIFLSQPRSIANRSVSLPAARPQNPQCNDSPQHNGTSSMWHRHW